MIKLKKIDILNFKVFNKREVFDLNAKNLLVYGTNGSGKSSLFWALYTFLQSSVKPQSEVEKYFDPGKEENLRNIFSEINDNSYIKISTINEDTKIENKYTIGVEIDSSGNKTYLINTIGNTEIEKANIASDFINYRMLLNFYNTTHKEQTDIFNVFKKDIFPFFNNNDNENFSNNYYELLDNTPNKQRDAQIALRGVKKLSPRTIFVFKRDYEKKRIKFNEDLKVFFDELNLEGNKFLREHFLSDSDSMRFEIGFKKNRIKDIKTGNNIIADENLQLSKNGELINPYITINVWQKDKSGTDVDIWRPHSFLNEAKLTQLSLSIRLAALKMKLRKSPNLFKLLVIDDLLISLDMSNRIHVLNIIFSEFQDFQLIILTHDKGFFDIISNKIKKKECDWVKLEFYETESSKNPIVKINQDYLLKAKSCLDGNEFDLAAFMCRKKAENLLQIYLDPELKYASIFDSKETLNDYFKKAKKHPYNLKFDKLNKIYNFNDIESIDLDNFDNSNSTLNASITGNKRTQLMAFREGLFQYSKDYYDWLKSSEQYRNDLISLIDDMEEMSSRILNPASHSSSNPSFKKEIEDAITKLNDVSKFLGIITAK